jgi:hypothetical protein
MSLEVPSARWLREVVDGQMTLARLEPVGVDGDIPGRGGSSKQRPRCSRSAGECPLIGCQLIPTPPCDRRRV